MSLNKTKIDWCDFTWNPLVGCKNNCFNSKCYAKQINNRYKFIPDWNEPKYYFERLTEPYKFNTLKNKGKKVFTVSMGDLFGSWVDAEFIKQVLKTAASCHNLQFMFLTKNPNRYLELLDRGNGKF